MPKGYWVITFRSVADPEKLKNYIELAAPVLAAAGVKYLVRGVPVQVYEAAVQERTVVIEFPSVAEAIAVYESAEYLKAVEALSGGAERDVRVVEGYE